MAYSSDNHRNDRRRGEQMPEEKQYDERVVHVDRVARVVKGGRRFRFRALVVIGDNKSKIGVGVAKGADVTAAVSKASDIAKKNLVSIAVTNNTIPHEVDGRVGGARIMIKPAAPGTGLIAGGVVRTVLEVGGVSNALSKSLGSNNKINIAYATVQALQSSLPREKWLNPGKITKPKDATKKPAAKKTIAKAEAK